MRRRDTGVLSKRKKSEEAVIDLGNMKTEEAVIILSSMKTVEAVIVLRCVRIFLTGKT
ncbi:MAG: hypothetical protein IKN45_07725 [Lachnospiraceae bacterium]|nr:hypothetical protein [Lachnospiraceae bacterium]